MSENESEYFEKGLLNFNEKDYDSAILNFSLALSINPNYYEAAYYAGLSYASKNEDIFAIPYFKEVIRINPNHDEAYFELAGSYGSIGEKDLARLTLITSAKMGNKKAQFLCDVMKLNYKPNETKKCPFCDEKISIYAKKCNFCKEFQDIEISDDLKLKAYEQYQKAGEFYDNDDYDSAILYYKKAIEYNPQYVEAYCSLGASYILKREFESAILFLNKAIEYNPEHYNSNLNLGCVYETIENLDMAIIYYKKTNEINPHNPIARAKLRELYKKRGH